jgi:hypothetical protein
LFALKTAGRIRKAEQFVGGAPCRLALEAAVADERGIDGQARGPRPAMNPRRRSAPTLCASSPAIIAMRRCPSSTR